MNTTRKITLLVAASAAAFFASVPQALAQSRSPADIDQIVGPIALYPDPLVSVVLPASTMPSEVQQAAQVVARGDTNAVDNQSWDDSVRAVAHYPDLVTWMSDNIDWTAQLGATFATQPADVLNSIQRLRARARAVGTLADTPQQRVVVEGELIAIVPAQPSVIYVPRYDPAIVYVEGPSRRAPSVLTFSTGFALGAWLTYDFDWRAHSLYVADHAWAEHRDWSRPSFSVAVNSRESRREWRPSADRAQVNVNVSKTVVTPRSMGGGRTASAEQNSTQRTNAAIGTTERSTEATNSQGAISQNQNQNPNPSSSTQANRPTANNATAANTSSTQPSSASASVSATNTTDRTAANRDASERTAADRAKTDRNNADRSATANVDVNARHTANPNDPSSRERDHTPEANRGAVSQNPERPNVSTSSATTQQSTPQAPKVSNSSSQSGALSSTEQSQRDQRGNANPNANANANESSRRPTPRGSVTAGSSGEYPTPSDSKDKNTTPQAAASSNSNLNQHPADDRSQRSENRPAMNSPTATPNQSQATSSANMQKTPTSTDKNQSNVQTKTETDEEKARKQKEEEDKKKKKPDGSDGA